MVTSPKGSSILKRTYGCAGQQIARSGTIESKAIDLAIELLGPLPGLGGEIGAVHAQRRTPDVAPYRTAL